jgi:hypothetical protein
MPLYDQPPPHSMDLYSNTTEEDAAGGRFNVANLEQAAIACSVNRGSAGRPSRYGQSQMVFPARIGVLTEYLDQYPARGWAAKITHTHTGEEQWAVFSGGYTIGEAYNGIPSLTYFSVEVYI